MSNERCAVRFLVLTGSFREQSYNDRLATLAATTVGRSFGEVDRASIADFEVPPFDHDLELDSGIPVGVRRFGDRLKAADGLIVASPEYNASMPGALKNLIDWTSRIRPQPFNGKQALLLSASTSMAGGNRGLWSLRIPLEHLGMRVYPDMFSLARAQDAFSGEGLADPTLQMRFDSTITNFIDLVEAAKHYPEVRKKWIEFLGEHPNEATDRIETTSDEAA